MLYLTRKLDEKIVLSDKDSGKTIASVTVAKFLKDDRENDIVELGIHASESVRINRDYNHGVRHENHIDH